MAGWVSRSQQDVIEYLQEENRLLRKQLGGKRLRLTDAQRRRLARKVGRRGLGKIETLVTPDILLRGARRPGRPKTAAEIEQLISRMAGDNPESVGLSECREKVGD